MNRNPIISKLASGCFSSIYGKFEMHSFTDGREEAIVLTLGDIQGSDNVLCRIQSECISSHVFFGTICDCREQMAASLKLISEHKKGIIIFLFQEGRGNGAAAHIGTLKYRLEGYSQSDAYKILGFPEDARNFNIAAKVIEFFSIKSVQLISGNKQKKNDLEKNGIKVEKLIHYSGNTIILGNALKNVITAIKEDKAISPIPVSLNDNRRIFLIGDLNIDFQIDGFQAGVIINKPAPNIGGTAYNAALAFNAQQIIPILFGKIGDDQYGRIILQELQNREFCSLIGIHPNKPTGSCNIIFFEDNQRWLIQDTDNANDYDLSNLEQALVLSKIGKDDIIFVVAHAFFRCGAQHCTKMFQLLHNTKAKIILDIVPHNLYNYINLNDLNQIIGDKIYAVIAEFPTFLKFINPESQGIIPTDKDYREILTNFNTSMIVCRYGVGNISKQSVYYSFEDGPHTFLYRDENTNYVNTTNENKRGFGDKLTSILIKQLITKKLL